MGFQKGHKINMGKKNHLGFKHSEETKLKIGLRLKGRKVWNKGIPWPAEIKERISQTNKNKGIEPKVKFIGLGNEHWNWKEDRTQLKRFNDTAKNRRSYAYTEWRKRVWLRDGFKCKINNRDCGGRIEAHHILNYTDFSELRYEINNGITLCRVHHPRKRIDERNMALIFQELVSPRATIYQKE